MLNCTLFVSCSRFYYICDLFIYLKKSLKKTNAGAVICFMAPAQSLIISNIKGDITTSSSV